MSWFTLLRETHVRILGSDQEQVGGHFQSEMVSHVHVAVSQVKAPFGLACFGAGSPLPLSITRKE